MDKEILKLKVQSLITLRTSLINILIVLGGGVVSLFFLPLRIISYFLGGVGIFYFFVFLSNLTNTNKELELLLNEKEN